jgi:hypothetical protein
MIDAREKGGVLSEVLSQTGVLSGAAWSAFLDGEQPELAIAFQGSDAVDDSLDLMAILSHAKLKARRASIAKVSSAGDLIRAKRRRTERVRRNLAQRQTAGQGAKVQD